MAKFLATIKKVADRFSRIFIKSVTWYLFAVLLFMLCIVFFYFSSMNENLFKSGGFLFAIVYLLGAFLSLFCGIMCKRNEARKSRYGYREYLLQELKKDEIIFTPDDEIGIDDKCVEDVVDDNVIETKRIGKKDILAQMLDNNDEIKEYFKISKKQAKLSFWISVIACAVGMFMLGLAIYGAIVVNDFKIAIIGTISGAITEVISGTVLWVHNKSALQLNHYYDALHQNEKFLSAINMADKLSEARREEMYIEIIRKQTEIRLSNDTNT